MRIKDTFKIKSKCLVLSAFVALAGLVPQSKASLILGSADKFAVLGGSTVTSTGNSVLNGDLGVAPGTAITGFGPGIVNGTTYAGVPFAAQAQADVLTAYNTLAGEAVLEILTDQDLGGLILTPGVYYFKTSAQLTGALTLDAQGNSNARFVFQIGSTLTTATSSSVLLINGAQADNVFWQVGSSATLGTGTSFAGSILANQSITFDYQASLAGRALALNAAVTMDDNVITVPTQASTSVVVSSSKNPAGFNNSVYFTATLPTNATGSVLFLTNGMAFSTNLLVCGSVSSSVTTLLSRGTNIITAQYAGDSNYFGSTNTLIGGQVVTNHPPVAAVMTVVGTKGVDLAISLAEVSTNWMDADGDPISLRAVNLTTTNGVGLYSSNWVYQTNGTLISIVTNFWSYIFYPGTNLVMADQISYSITDGQGGTNIGYINIVVNSSVTGNTSISQVVSGNPTTLTAYGIPGYSYIAERSTDLSSWVDISTNAVGANGMITVNDYFSDLGGQKPSSAFYRLKWQSP